jgi:uncharacterized RDD family membrane protein YckC
MGEKIVEPSEIIIDRQGLPKDKVSHINPQIRLLARFFDYSLFLFVLWGLRLLMGGSFPLGLFEYLIPFEFFAWIPIEAFLLSTWGTTPGKFLLRTKISQGRKSKLDFKTALKRSFNVWFRGLGMGIPVINILCMLVASSRLRMLGMTSWDREDNITVTHFPVSQWRVVVASVVTFFSFIGYYSNKHGVFSGGR